MSIKVHRWQIKKWKTEWYQIQGNQIFSPKPTNVKVCVCGSPAGIHGGGRRHAGCHCRPRANALRAETAGTLWALPCPEPSVCQSSSEPRRMPDWMHRPMRCAAFLVRPPAREYLREHTHTKKMTKNIKNK